MPIQKDRKKKSTYTKQNEDKQKEAKPETSLDIKFLQENLTEEELEKGCLQAFHQALHYPSGFEVQELQALEKALVYAKALQKYALDPYYRSLNLLYLYEIEKALGLYYRTQEEISKAAVCLEEAAKIGNELCEDVIDLEPGAVARVYAILTALYLKLNEEDKMYACDRESLRLERDQKDWDGFLERDWMEEEDELDEEDEMIYGWMDSMTVIEKLKALDDK